MKVTLTATLDYTYTVERQGKPTLFLGFDDFRRLRTILTKKCVSFQTEYNNLVWTWHFYL